MSFKLNRQRVELLPLSAARCQIRPIDGWAGIGTNACDPWEVLAQNSQTGEYRWHTTTIPRSVTQRKAKAAHDALIVRTNALTGR